MDGVPLKKVEVRFVPVEDVGGGYIAKGTTDEAGRFTLTCKGEPGACVGQNHVLISEAEFPAPPPRRASSARAGGVSQFAWRPAAAARLRNLVESPLKVDVQAANKDYVLDLVRP